MAQLTLTVNDAKAVKIVEAFENRFGPKDPGETAKQFMTRHIKELIKREVKNQLGEKARQEAVEAFEDPFEIS